MLVLFLAVTLISVPSVLANSLIGRVWDRILDFGALSFLDSGMAVVSFTRILIGILIFTIFFAVLTTLAKGQGKSLGFLNKSQAMVVALIMAIISAIFSPAEVLLAIGTGWATAIALILIGVPVIGIGYLFMNWPGKDKDGKSEENKGTLFVKIIACLLLIWILNAMRYHIGVIS